MGILRRVFPPTRHMTEPVGVPITLEETHELAATLYHLDIAANRDHEPVDYAMIMPDHRVSDADRIIIQNELNELIKHMHQFDQLFHTYVGGLC